MLEFAPRCRVLIADEQTMLRAGIRFALESDGFEVVGEAARGDDAVALAQQTHPDICLVDLLIPRGGPAMVRELQRTVPDARVVVLAAVAPDADVFELLIAGAAGVLPKGTPSDRLAPTLRGVLAGEAALTRRMTASLIREFQRRERSPRTHRHGTAADHVLTDREAEVLELLADGHATSQIAGELRISDVTVRRHVSTIRRKMAASDRSSLIVMAREARKTPA